MNEDVDEIIEELEEETEVRLNFTQEQLEEALSYAEDMMDRCSIEFMLLGDTAKEAIDEDLGSMGTEFIHLGVLKKYVTASGISMLRTIVSDVEFDGRSFAFRHREVPIIVDIVFGSYNFFNHPRKIFYKFSEYLIPNPFEKYYDIREDIK